MRLHHYLPAILKKPLQAVLVLVSVTSTLVILVSYSKLVANIYPGNDLIPNPSLINKYDTADNISSLSLNSGYRTADGSVGTLRSVDRSRFSEEESRLPEARSSCETEREKVNWTECQGCMGPIMETFVQGLEASDARLIGSPGYKKYFKTRPEVVQLLVTDYLIEPRLDCPYLLAVQLSVLDRRSERDTVRSTWGSVAREQSWPNRKINAKVKVLFVVTRENSTTNAGEGRQAETSEHTNSRLWDEIKSEADENNDILCVNMIDSYTNLTLKILSAFKWVKDNCPCVKFVLKVDYDTFVNVPLMVDNLVYFENRFNFSIIGMVGTWGGAVPRRGKWAVQVSVYPFSTFPVYASGCGYIISFAVLAKIMNAVQNFPLLPVEDVFITGVMRRVIGCSIFASKKVLFIQHPEKSIQCHLFINIRMMMMSLQGQHHNRLWKLIVNDACNDRN